jgi:HindIII restriction endonuclease
MTYTHFTSEAIARRRQWVSEIVKIVGAFGPDTQRVEEELKEEIEQSGLPVLLDHLRLCGAIPEFYGHDSSEEKLYSKYTDILLAAALRQVGLNAVVLAERADAADVEAATPKGAAFEYSLVGDAKVFRLSRTAKNQKDFKMQAMDDWKRGKPYALVVGPLYQLPRRQSQIYQQAATRNVCLLSYSHLAVLAGLAEQCGPMAASEALGRVLQAVESLIPSKDAVEYWTAVNRTMLAVDDVVPGLWKTEKLAALEAIGAAKEEGLVYLASEREEILKLDHAAALERLIAASNIDRREAAIEAIGDNGLFDLAG